MKIAITADMKKVLRVADMPAVNKVINAVKEDSSTAKEYAEQAARIASGNNIVKVLEADAKIAFNARAWDSIADGSGQCDVWFDFTAIIDGGFDGIIMGGAYLTDIWQATGENNEELRKRMYIRKFIESK